MPAGNTATTRTVRISYKAHSIWNILKDYKSHGVVYIVQQRVGDFALNSLHFVPQTIFLYIYRYFLQILYQRYFGHIFGRRFIPTEYELLICFSFVIERSESELEISHLIKYSLSNIKLSKWLTVEEQRG